MEIIPSLNCPDLECVASRAGEAAKFAPWVHLDVADAKFTFNKSWNDPAAWGKVSCPAALEVHLMVEDPEPQALRWLDAGARRVIVQVETIIEETFRAIAASAARHGAEVMLSSRPETPPTDLEPYFSACREFQVLSVYPGPSGQQFLPLTLQKARFLRHKVPDAIIEMDGGIEPATAAQAREAGANLLVAGQYLFGSPDGAAAAYARLKAI